MFLEFLRWWYGPGWLEAWRTSYSWAVQTEKAFSVGVLLRTLFSPWKRIVALPGRSLDEKFRSAVDNLISRTVGFFARLTALLAAAVLLIFVAVLGLVAAIAWPLLPLGAIYFLARSILG